MTKRKEAKKIVDEGGRLDTPHGTVSEPAVEEGEVVDPPKSEPKITLGEKIVDVLAGVCGVVLAIVGIIVSATFQLLWIALKIGFIVFVVWVILKLLGIA